jgi:hypothetical protein
MVRRCNFRVLAFVYCSLMFAEVLVTWAVEYSKYRPQLAAET